jgi:hypothetical protein
MKKCGKTERTQIGKKMNELQNRINESVCGNGEQILCEWKKTD